MEVKESFKIFIEFTNKKIGEGYIYFELNGVRFVNSNIDYDIKHSLFTIHKCIYRNNENFSSIFYNLSKQDIIHLFNCYFGRGDIEDFPHLKSLEKIFEERFSSLRIYNAYYSFDTFGVWHIKLKRVKM